jgi:uncharacterized protein YndB with AHSA1/START domain
MFLSSPAKGPGRNTEQERRMVDETGRGRSDTVSRTIMAPPSVLYRACVDADAVASWLPPDGMKGALEVFDPREGGIFRMTLTYEHPDPAVRGKTSENADTVEGRFLKLVPDRQIVQAFAFESEDTAFAGTMTMTWSFEPVTGGTDVTILCENVPEGIRQEDHLMGMRSSLENLAAFAEHRG